MSMNEIVYTKIIFDKKEEEKEYFKAFIDIGKMKFDFPSVNLLFINNKLTEVKATEELKETLYNVFGIELDEFRNKQINEILKFKYCQKFKKEII